MMDDEMHKDANESDNVYLSVIQGLMDADLSSNVGYELADIIESLLDRSIYYEDVDQLAAKHVGILCGTRLMREDPASSSQELLPNAD